MNENPYRHPLPIESASSRWLDFEIRRAYCKLWNSAVALLVLLILLVISATSEAPAVWLLFHSLAVFVFACMSFYRLCRLLSIPRETRGRLNQEADLREGSTFAEHQRGMYLRSGEHAPDCVTLTDGGFCTCGRSWEDYDA